MKRSLIGFMTVGLVLALCASAAEAQLVGYPVAAWTAGPGVTISGDFARGLNTESGQLNAFGGRIGVSTPIVGVWAGAGSLNMGSGLGSELTFAGGLALKVFDPPLAPVQISLQAGAGILNQTVNILGVEESLNTMNVPIGVAFAFKAPTPGVNIQPWIMPRLHYNRVSFAGLSGSNVGFGASGGVNLTLPVGFGGHLAIDYMSIDSASPIVVGMGLHYTIPFPGVPIVPGM